MRHFIFSAVIVSILGLFGLASASAAGQLSVDKPGDWTLVVADDALPSERYAAEEFQWLFREAMGTELPLAAQASKKRRNIFIGPGAAKESGQLSETGHLGEEGLCIQIKPENIIITGGRPRGTLYGVYEFMERYLSVRFLTKDHTHIPKHQSLQLPIESYTYVPTFEFRWSYYRENQESHELAARLRVNTTPREEKFGGIAPQSLINHSFHRHIPVEKYGKEHPEYFALVDGERKLDIHGGGPEPCVSDPKVIEIVTQSVLNDLAANPNRRNISVSQNDNDAYCRCERCEKINQAEGTPMGAQLALVNAVADRVAEEYPEVKVGTLSYWYTRKPPKHMKPRDNVQIQLCSIECCTFFPIDTPTIARNREFCEDMEKWGEICDDIWIWNYNTNFTNYDLPFPNLRTIGPNIRYFLKNNAKGIFMQANGNGLTGEMSDLRNYVISKTLWHPELDSWDLVEEFCHLHYQESAQPILDYLTMIHDNAETAGVFPNCFANAAQLGLTPEIADKAYDLFQVALNRANSDAVYARVEKAMIPIYRTLLEMASEFVYADYGCTLHFPEKYGDVIETYIALGKKYNMTRVAEHKPAEDFYKKVHEIEGSKIPACQLENDTWKLTIFYEDNGKAGELIHKPSGRNLLEGLEISGISNFLERGTFKELGLKGYDPNDPKPFQVRKEYNAIMMFKTLPNESVLMRRIRLMDNDSQDILCETRLTHKNNTPQVYQFKVNPEFNTWTKSGNHELLSAYIRDDEWKCFNRDWEKFHGPDGHLLEECRGGALAYFNHETSSGILLSYTPDMFERPYLYWLPDVSQINLELVTPSVELKKGETLSYSYRFSFLDKPPQ